MIKPLTSLRFVFALMVFLHHLSFLKLHGGAYSDFYQTFCAEGYIGVNFFFMLSGFILAYVYQDKIVNKSAKASTFWIYRFARIYPLHLLTLIIALPTTYKIFVSGFIPWFMQFSSNLLLLHSFIPDSAYFFSFNSVSWSISTEMFFYFLFPFVIPFITKISKNKLYIALAFFIIVPTILVSINLIDPMFYHRLFYINPIFRFLDFAIGIFLYNIVRNLKLKNNKANFLEIFTILIMLASFFFSKYIPQVYRYSVFYWIPTALLIGIFYFQSGFLSRFIFSNKYFVILGEISFGFYMFHQLVMKYFDKINIHFLSIENPILIIAIYFLLTLIISIISYYYFELPLNRLIKNRLLKKRPK
ncbi:MAG: acyltransferase [Bacteroidales bacterium]|nr:acyltransferase [Bacteroidales bacterium]